MGRSGPWLVVPWVVFPLGELWFAMQGFNVPSPAQIAGEIGVWVVLGLAQWRFAPAGWARSPLWAGVLPLAWVWFLLGPRGGIGLVHLVGTFAVAFAVVVRAERERPFGVPEGAVLAVLAAVGGRWLVLSQGSGHAAGGGQTSVARSPAEVIRRELTAPLASTPQRESDGPPLVLITVDTLRADAGERMQAFNRLASRGTQFTHAVSTSSWTVPAVASALTGLMPAAHGAGMDDAGGLHGVSPGVPTLAEVLRERGYDTAAFTTNAWLTTPLGYSRGFDTWGHADERFHHMLAATGFPKGAKAREAERVVDRAIDWLDGEEGDGFFLWVHLLDPHLPYAHAEGKLERGLSDESLRAGLRLDASVVERVKAAYQREVDYADAQLMRLLDALEAKGVLDRGLVVLTADHGEELWDHGGTGHGHTHHREVVQIPLVLAGRGVVRGPAPEMVSLLDVPSTLALAAGASLGAGRDLRAPGSVDRVVTSQGNAYYHAQRSAWTMGGRAMLLTAAQDAPERCYDLNADPGEHTPIPCAPGSPALEAARAERAPSAEADAAELSREALKALGYVN